MLRVGSLHLNPQPRSALLLLRPLSVGRSALLRHFGSLRGLSRASFQELRQFLPQRRAEAVMAALSVSVIAETEHARSSLLDHPESIYRACVDIKLLTQEVVRVVLVDARYRLITAVDITKGGINECLAQPRDVFRGSMNNFGAIIRTRKIAVAAPLRRLICGFWVRYAL